MQCLPALHTSLKLSFGGTDEQRPWISYIIAYNLFAADRSHSDHAFCPQAEGGVDKVAIRNYNICHIPCLPYIDTEFQ